MSVLDWQQLDHARLRCGALEHQWHSVNSGVAMWQQGNFGSKA
jgi:hypothetical protein